MRRREGKFNPKRKVRECSEADVAFLENLYSRVSYGGNPQHKKNPGDFGLNPPSDPRAMKSLCDEVSIYRRSEALHLLKEGISRGLVSVQTNVHGFPQNIWTVLTFDNGKQVPLEAQLENPVLGSYHGYPVPPTDPMYEKILDKWRMSRCLISK